MNHARPISEWLDEKQISVPQLVQSSGLEPRVVEAMVAGRWTPSPQQRERIAASLDVDVQQIQWGHEDGVDPMYGHGPQFGRSP